MNPFCLVSVNCVNHGYSCYVIGAPLTFFMFVTESPGDAHRRCVCVSLLMRWSYHSLALSFRYAAKHWKSVLTIERMDPFVSHIWWRHQLETFSALLALCVGNSPVTGEFPSQRPVTRSFDVFYDLRLNQQLSKQWGRLRFETPLRSLWRHCNEFVRLWCPPLWHWVYSWLKIGLTKQLSDHVLRNHQWCWAVVQHKRNVTYVIPSNL